MSSIPLDSDAQPIDKTQIDSIQLDPVPQRIALLDEFVADHTEILTIEKEKLSYFLTGLVKLNGELLFKARGDRESQRLGSIVSDSSDRDLFSMAWQTWPRSPLAAWSLDGKMVLKVNEAGFLKWGSWNSKDRATFTSTTGTKHVLHLLRADPTNVDGKPHERTFDTKWLDINIDIIDSSTGAVVARMYRHPLDGGVGEVIVAPGVDKVLIGMVAICCYELNDPDQQTVF